jgi:5-methyltetrahydrofolate--homocysteine methyltransferase
MAENSELYEAILIGDAEAAEATAKKELAAGVQPMELITKSMIPSMDEVGRLFEAEEYYFPELLMSGQAMKAAMVPIRPLLAAAGQQAAGTVVVGTVHGDRHDIGKNLVITMLEGAGFEVYDLGTDVPPEKFVEAIRQYHPQILCMSALLTVTMPAMKTTIDVLTTSGVRDQVKVMIGGSPVTQHYATEIGADGYSETANGAVVLARNLMGKVA